MAEFKLVISNPNNGYSAQHLAKEQSASALIGLKIGDKISGDSIGIPGYEFQITGGSDYCGFPMRRDVSGTARKRILAVSGVGLKMSAKGIRQRKTVCGNTIYERTAQVNLKVMKEGKDPLFEAAQKKAADNKAVKEAKKAERIAAKTPSAETAEPVAEPAGKAKPAKEKKHVEKPVEPAAE